MLHEKQTTRLGYPVPVTISVTGYKKKNIKEDKLQGSGLIQSGSGTSISAQSGSNISAQSGSRSGCGSIKSLNPALMRIQTRTLEGKFPKSNEVKKYY
jgi:hypothetical protein